MHQLPAHALSLVRPSPKEAPTSETGQIAPSRLLDEIEQLRTALETSFDENARLLEERDRLLRRLTAQARDLHDSKAHGSAVGLAADHGPAEEELRIALEGLQVLSEELEVANTSLHEANRELDRRVAERTRTLADANAALQASEASFRAVADLVPDLLWRTDRSGVQRWFNQRWHDYTGQSAKEALADRKGGVVHPRDRATARSGWYAAVTSGEPYRSEYRLRGSDGSYRWFLVRAEPLRNPYGEIVQWFGAATDIHDERLALEALRHSERRFRTLVEGLPLLVWRANGSGKRTWSSPQWTAYTGMSEEASRLHGWRRALHPDDRAVAREAWLKTAEGEPLEFEARIFNAAEKRYRHFRSRATPVVDESGRTVEWLGTSTDVDDLLQMRDRQSVLLAELQHRVRNILSLIRSLIRRSYVPDQSSEDYIQHLEGRLAALARTQVLLTRRTGAGVDLEELIRDELLAQVADEARIAIGGPDVMLAPKSAEVLTLAVHELTVNAVKYGALSQEVGRIAIAWSVDKRDRQPWLRLSWIESGVSVIAPVPRREGFGTELITERVPYELRGEGRMELRPGGLSAAIEFPLLPGDSILDVDAAATVHREPIR